MKFSEEITRLVGMPAYLNDGSETPPAPEHHTYVVVGKTGMWKFHQDDYLSSCVKMNGFNKLKDVDVTAEKPVISWHGPKLPTKTFWFVRDYFIAAWEEFHSEFDVQLWYSKSLGKFLLRIPKQTISAASVDWEITDNDPWYVDEVEINKKDVPADVFHIGRMHSHNEMSAFWSGTDTHDQVTQEYGIQIVMGKITKALEYRCCIAYNGRTVDVPLLTVVEDPLIPRVQKIKIPTRCVVRSSYYYNGTNYGGGYGNVYGQSSYSGGYGHYENGVWVPNTRYEVTKPAAANQNAGLNSAYQKTTGETDPDDEEEKKGGIAVIAGERSPDGTSHITQETAESDYSDPIDTPDPSAYDADPFPGAGARTRAEKARANAGGHKSLKVKLKQQGEKTKARATIERFAADPCSQFISESETLFSAACECAKQLINTQEGEFSKDAKWLSETLLDEFPSEKPIQESIDTDPEIGALLVLSCCLDWLNDRLPFKPSEDLERVFHIMGLRWRTLVDTMRQKTRINPVFASGAYDVTQALNMITRFAALISEVNLCSNTAGEALYNDPHRDIVAQLMLGKPIDVSMIRIKDLNDTLNTLVDKVSCIPSLFFFLSAKNPDGLAAGVKLFTPAKETKNA